MTDTLREWFFANRSLVLFTYGQVFFILGLAIVLQSRQRSRLRLARSLPWLAAFGILHGLNEWGDLFIPIQAQFVPAPLIALLQFLQLILLAVSFACLLQFGVELFGPFPPRWRFLHFLPGGLFLLWLIFPLLSGLILTSSLENWQQAANVWARYLLCLPGGFLSGWGLVKQSGGQIRPLGLNTIERLLKIAAGALIAYGLLGGLIVPPQPFFPASFINTETFSHLFIVSPAIFRSLSGLVLAISIIGALEVFDVEMERLILRMEEDQMIALERERMARDLHDGALQQVYAAGLLAQSLQKKAAPAEAEGLQRLVLTINQSIEQLRAFLQQGQQEIENIGLIPALEAILDETRRILPVTTHWETPQPPILTPEQISHLTAFTREALSNAIRHAQTDSVEVRLSCVDEHLRLTIHDFGLGLADDHEAGYGLRNMRDRARLLGAELRFESAPGQGTSVILDLPVEENQ
ncbi:MAG: histidine kinase [Anaerolineales bacterium]